MWRKPLTDGNLTESLYAYDTKIQYCKAKFKDTYNELSLRKFSNKLKKDIENGTIKWNHRRIPSYDTMKGKWWKKYKWEECSKAYTDDALRPQREHARLIYAKRYLNDITKDFKRMDELYLRNDILFSKQKNNEGNYDYVIAKNEETVDLVWRRLVDKLNLDDLLFEQKLRNKKDVVEDPAWLDPSNLEKKTELLRRLIFGDK